MKIEFNNNMQINKMELCREKQVGLNQDLEGN